MKLIQILGSLLLGLLLTGVSVQANPQALQTGVFEQTCELQFISQAADTTQPCIFEKYNSECTLTNIEIKLVSKIEVDLTIKNKYKETDKVIAGDISFNFVATKGNFDYVSTSLVKSFSESISANETKTFQTLSTSQTQTAVYTDSDTFKVFSGAGKVPLIVKAYDNTDLNNDNKIDLDKNVLRSGKLIVTYKTDNCLSVETENNSNSNSNIESNNTSESNSESQTLIPAQSTSNLNPIPVAIANASNVSFGSGNKYTFTTNTSTVSVPATQTNTIQTPPTNATIIANQTPVSDTKYTGVGGTSDYSISSSSDLVERNRAAVLSTSGSVELIRTGFSYDEYGRYEAIGLYLALVVAIYFFVKNWEEII